MAEQIARKYLISGRVQGVCFRWFTHRAAESLGVRGYVRNLPDDRVEAWAQGSASQLESFRKELQRGPPSAIVTEIGEQEVQPSAEFAGFSITY